jgi:hypothetical protein
MPRRSLIVALSFNKTAEIPLWCWRRRLETVWSSPVLLCMLLFHGLVAQHAESEVRDSEAAENDQSGEKHSFVRDGFHKGVENLGESVCADFGAGDFHWVTGHRALPDVAGLFEIWGAFVRSAAVFAVMLCRVHDFGDDFGAGFEGFLFDVALDGGVEAVENPAAAHEQENVEE